MAGHLPARYRFRFETEVSPPYYTASYTADTWQLPRGDNHEEVVEKPVTELVSSMRLIRFRTRERERERGREIVRPGFFHLPKWRNMNRVEKSWQSHGSRPIR